MNNRLLLPAAIAALIFAGALIANPVHPCTGCGTLAHTGYESIELAQSLALHGSFADPFLPMATGASAQLAPGYPAFVALLIGWFGNGPGAILALRWCTTLVIAAQLCLLPFLTRSFKLGYAPGALAAVVFLTSGIPREDWWEQNYTGLLMIVLSILMYRMLTRESSTLEAVCTGTLWGFSLLVSPVLLPALGLWLCAMFWATGKPLSQKLALVLLPTLVVCPWLVRNYEVFDQFVFVRDNLGMELAVSNNACAEFSFIANRISGCYALQHPNENADEAARVRSLGEVPYNGARMREAKAWIGENPERFIRLTGERIAAFWVPSALPVPGARRKLDAVVSAASILCVAGLVLLWRRNRMAMFVVLCWLLTYPPIYYLTQYNERFRLPLLWAILLPGCCVLTVAAEAYWSWAGKR